MKRKADTELLDLGENGQYYYRPSRGLEHRHLLRALAPYQATFAESPEAMQIVTELGKRRFVSGSALIEGQDIGQEADPVAAFDREFPELWLILGMAILNKSIETLTGKPAGQEAPADTDPQQADRMTPLPETSEPSPEVKPTAMT